MSSFNGSEAALSSTLAAQGGYYSGAHYTQSRNTLLATVQAFATDGLAFVQSNARTAAIDHAAVVALFNGYAAQDSVFSDSYYRAAGWGLSGTGLEGFITDTAALTTSIYAPLGQLIP